MGTSLSSILKKKKVLENNDDTYESESNSTGSGITSFEESQKKRAEKTRKTGLVAQEFNQSAYNSHDRFYPERQGKSR